MEMLFKNESKYALALAIMLELLSGAVQIKRKDDFKIFQR